MPELPEVETVVRRIRPAFEGLSIDHLEVIDGRWCKPASAASFEKRIIGQRVLRVWRKGKYILLDLDSGETLIMHLRMTGTILLNPEGAIGHERAEFGMSDASKIVFNDPRRFGTAELVPTLEVEEWFKGRLGLEPFDPNFTNIHLFGLTRGRKAPLKNFLLDQRLIAGIGNIYADEALFRARLHPLRKPLGLTKAQVSDLRGAIVDSLQAGIDAGGATIDDFRSPDGAWGAYQSEFLVHRREGLPCPNCANAVERIKVGGRSTYFCRSCQPPPVSTKR